MRRVATLFAAAAAVVVVCGCGTGASPTTPPTTPSAMTLDGPLPSISELTAIDVSREGAGCSPADPETVIDQLDFKFQNPGRRDLTGFGLLTDPYWVVFGPLSVCVPARCDASHYANPVCIVEGDTTSESGRIRAFVGHVFQPVTEYQLRLVGRTATAALSSNIVAASIVRLPGRPNNRAAIAEVRTWPPLQQAGYWDAGAAVTVYREPGTSDDPRRIEIQVEWYRVDSGRLIQLWRATLAFSPAVFSEEGLLGRAFSRPPWRVVVRMRETGAPPPPRERFFSCNVATETPITTVPCGNDATAWPAAEGPVLTEDVRELIVQ